MTVTLAVHPLAGRILAVVRWIRSRDGRRYVDMRHPAGHVFRLPLDYTDRALPVCGAARESRVSVVGLLRMAAAVSTAQRACAGQKLDECGGQERSRSRPEHTLSYHVDGSTGNHGKRLPGAGAVAAGQQPDPGCAGDAGPPAVAAGSEHGGKR